MARSQTVTLYYTIGSGACGRLSDNNERRTIKDVRRRVVLSGRLDIFYYGDEHSPNFQSARTRFELIVVR